jgi:uncharacterized protein YifN (PemK superfamily)
LAPETNRQMFKKIRFQMIANMKANIGKRVLIMTAQTNGKPITIVPRKTTQRNNRIIAYSFSWA